MFLRVRREMEITPTFKPKKSDSARDGFNPARMNDAIYFNDCEREAFVPLDEALHRRIIGGEVRL